MSKLDELAGNPKKLNIDTEDYVKGLMLAFALVLSQTIGLLFGGGVLGGFIALIVLAGIIFYISYKTTGTKPKGLRIFQSRFFFYFCLGVGLWLFLFIICMDLIYFGANR